ncbi:MAG: nucleoside hydrolase [Armatimonadota bacterium]|nr:nucleoside hydrolase [Armatimonadota bacterium]
MLDRRYAVVMDVDTGHDDAFAILLAARHVDLLGITTVSGNAPLANTTANTLKILELGGLTDIPVAAGMDRPLVSPPQHAPAIHGRSGLDGPDLPAPRTAPDPRHGVQFMIDVVRAHPGCWIVATGPLTNVAVALRQAPDLATCLAGISLMGGSTAGGNVTAAAEFNIYCDPEAAAVVFESGVPIRMVGLNLTRQALVLDPEVARIRALCSRLGEVAAELLEFYNRTAREVFGRPGGLLHDPCAVAWMIAPTLIEFQPMHVAVELTGARTRGMTVCDWRFEQGTSDRLRGYAGIQAGEPPNAEVGMRLDRERFFDLLITTLASYP